MPDQPLVEQCCYVTEADDASAVAKVRMFGDEFCVNATRSVAWLLSDGINCQGLIESSGVDKTLKYRVQNSEVSLEMPLPANKQELISVVREGSLVYLEGIAQLVITSPKLRRELTPRERLTELLKSKSYGLTDWPAIGVSYYDAGNDSAEFCVWVKRVNTMFDETACGSGTAAIGAVIASERKAPMPLELNVVQPSGEAIKVTAVYGGGKVEELWVSGPIKVLYDGRGEKP